MDQQHPIPQEISSYQFRLVGDMTLKQFFQLAGGLLVSLLFYASALHPLIKWPIILFFGLLGVALAFLPFEDRPLDRWIVAFFRSIYSPTIFSWRSASKRAFFQPEADGQVPSSGIAAQGEQPIKADTRLPFLKKLEEAETAFLSRVSGLFSGKTQSSQQQVQVTPQPQVQQVSQTPSPAPQPQQVQPIQQQKSGSEEGVKIPKTEYVKIQKSAEEQKRPVRLVVEEQGETPTTTVVSPVLTQQKGGQDAKEATFSLEASPPSPPSSPNTVVGQVMGPKGQIVEGAILEIKDVAGRPVRAVKTNKLGHFIIVTPLQDGKYEIVIEKEGYQFGDVTFDAVGEIVPPIAIYAQAEVKKEATQN